MLMRVVRCTFGIMVLKAGPQDLPADAVLTYISIALYVALNVVTFYGPSVSVLAGVLETFAATAILGVFTHTLLRLKAWPERFNQTFSALLLTGVVFTALAIGPMLHLAPYLTNGERPPLLLVLGPIAILIWRIAVMAHVFRHALEIGIGRAVGVVLIFDLVRWMLLMMLALIGISGGVF